MIPTKTFCAAPWFMLRNQQSGRFLPCSVFDPDSTNFSGDTCYAWPRHTPEDFMNSEYMQWVRKNLHQGIKINECRRCWQKEAMGQKSPRQTCNDTVTRNQSHQLDQTWLGPFFLHQKNWHTDLLLSADIKLSNHCNLSCMQCHPHDSSRIYSIWKSQIDHPAVSMMLQSKPTWYLEDIYARYKNNNNYDLLDQMLHMNVMHLKILGGEPLLDTKMIDMLSKLGDQKKQKISLLFTTNGTQDLLEFADRLGPYKQINFVVSLDGIGVVQEYIRRGSNWAQIESNIDKWNGKHRPVDIHCTVSCLNLMRVSEIQSWCEQKNLQLTYGMVEDPDFLSCASLPQHLRNRIISDTRLPKNLLHNLESNSTIFEDFKYDPSCTQKLGHFLQWFDPKHEWKTLFPELKSCNF